MVGRRATRVRSLANIPTRRARCASAPTSPHGGEASYASSIFSEHPHPAGSLRERADLPTWWGGELREFDLYRTSPPGELAARARRPPHMVGTRLSESSQDSLILLEHSTGIVMV